MPLLPILPGGCAQAVRYQHDHGLRTRNGDIGEIFSDNDPANAGRDSIQMLGAAVKRIKAKGYAVAQVDITVIAEFPRITAHRDAMRIKLSQALGIAVSAVSVKGKTNERMGWIGRGEGIACIAVATVTGA